ncbi:MAG: hypothetical protein ACTSX8_02280 [Alphaproteobacteria bacterium]
MRARTVVPILFFLALAGAGASAGAATPSRKPNSPVELPENDEDIAEFGMTVCQCVAELTNAGVEVTGNTLRACVVDRWFPTTEFPPIESDPESVKAAWALTTSYVQAYLDDPAAFIELWCMEDTLDPPTGPGAEPDPGEPSTQAEFKPSPETIPGGITPPPVQFLEAPASMAGYPWEMPIVHKGGDGKHAPTPGMFYIVNKSNAVAGLDSMLEIARYALGSAYAMAGAPRSLGSIPAEEVLAYLNLIVCSPWNDTAYGTSSEQAAGGELGLGPQGRGINMYPRHHDNIQALIAGTKPQRTTLLNGAVDQMAPEQGNRFPQLWLPPINLNMLKDFGVVTTQGMEWSTTDTVLLPPPAVWAHGVYSRVAAPAGWGCN